MLCYVIMCEMCVSSEAVKERTTRKKPRQATPLIESLPSEYSYPESPSVSDETPTSEQPPERSPPPVCLCYVVCGYHVKFVEWEIVQRKAKKLGGKSG